MTAAELARHEPPATRWFATLPALRRVAAAAWMNTLILAVIGVGAITTGVVRSHGALWDGPWTQRAVAVFTVWLLAFLPGWLYVRFLGLRGKALWNDFVLNLYRLRIDRPEYLPRPPADSEYVELSGALHGGHERDNIYRQKFNAYYGPTVSDLADRDGSDRRSADVTVDSLFPVFVCTATLAVGWSAILWNPTTLMRPLEPWAALEFGFVGAYAFAVSLLIRRFFQSDLRPSAYASIVVRIVIVLCTVALLHQLFTASGVAHSAQHRLEYVAAFVVGFFPLVGLQALQRAGARTLHSVVPHVVPRYPLDRLDGLSVWDEARLMEEGVEDMQNLTTANLVEVILHTRAPVGRLVDWIDQAVLCIHLAPETDGAGSEKDAPAGGGTTSPRVALRRVGIRTATDFLAVFRPDLDGSCPLSDADIAALQLDPAGMRALARVLAAEPALNVVRNWKHGAPRLVTAE
jgi:hypothetical protein